MTALEQQEISSARRSRRSTYGRISAFRLPQVDRATAVDGSMRLSSMVSASPSTKVAGPQFPCQDGAVFAQRRPGCLPRRAGENPADDIRREKETPTFREFAEEYLRRSEPHWKPSGRETVRIYLKARIL